MESIIELGYFHQKHTKIMQAIHLQCGLEQTQHQIKQRRAS